MTKIRNTKKGMAKKTLSISLAVAMLATSNVPVWAAEDLFTDGAAAVETVEAPVEDVFSDAAEEVVEEAPVVEEEEALVANSYTTGNQFVATITPFKYGESEIGNSVVWGKGDLTTTVSVKDNDVIAGVKLHATWKKDGVAIEDVDKATELKWDEDNGVHVLSCRRTITSEDANHKLQLFVYAERDGVIEWSYTSDEIKVLPKNINDCIKFKEEKPIADVQYTGDIRKPEISDTWLQWINGCSLTTDPKIGYASRDYDIAYDVWNDPYDDFVNVTGNDIVVTLKPLSTAYTGTLSASYKIIPMELNNNEVVADRMKVEFKNTNILFDGKNNTTAKVKKEDIALVDKATGEDLSNYLNVDVNGYVTVEYLSGTYEGWWVHLAQGTPATGNRNYKLTNADQGYRRIMSTNNLEIQARDLSTVDVVIERKASATTTVTLNEADVKFYDKNTHQELSLWNYVKLTVPGNAYAVGTYDVIIEPNGGERKVTGKTSAKLYIYASDIKNAVFWNKEQNNVIVTPSKYYTGEEITFSEDEIGVPSINKDGVQVPLKSTDYTIEYANNINASTTANLFLIGQDSYVNSVKKYTFEIKKTPVSSITRNAYVGILNTDRASDYAEAMAVTVKGKVPNTNKELTLVDGKDYTVDYEFVSKADGKYVQATVNLKTNGNFDNTSNVNTVVESKLVKSALKSEHIKLKENDFTYTGEAIKPAFDVVIDGYTIDKDQFDVVYTDNVNAGVGRITVTCNEKALDYQGSASVDFTIKSADASKLVGVIPTQQYKGYSIEIPAGKIDLTLDGKVINVEDNFTITNGENLEIGEGTVTLTPKNSNFDGAKELTFKIVGELLNDTGDFVYVDADGFVIDGAKKVFKYNGTAQEFAKTTLDYKAKAITEGKDYEIKYVDNVYGQAVNGKQYAAVLAIAKGKYGGALTTKDTDLIKVKDGVYTDVDGNKIANVFDIDFIEIQPETVRSSNITVSNGTYAGGLLVKPVVSIVVKGMTLVEGRDFDLDLTGNKDLVNATEKDILDVTVKPKNGYRPYLNDGFTFKWGIDKFNLKNAVVTVDGTDVTVKCGNVIVPSKEYTTEMKDGEVTVTATKDNKNYTGSKTVYARTEDQKPETPMIVDVDVYGNKATVILSGESDGAVGYDYVIGKKDCIETKDYVKVNKNKLTTETTFTYTQEGTYYAYCHAWKRDMNGAKVFSDWSNPYIFSVRAITPETPVITGYKVNGSTVTVTYTKAANADGYDVVLGTTYGTVADEKRPLEYGELVKKNIKGNTVTATFKNVPKGTYYAGLHAYNRTSEDGKKVFSPWSNIKTIKVK